MMDAAEGKSARCDLTRNERRRSGRRLQGQGTICPPREGLTVGVCWAGKGGLPAGAAPRRRPRVVVDGGPLLARVERRSQPGGSGRSEVLGRAVLGRAVVGRLLRSARRASRRPAPGRRPWPGPRSPRPPRGRRRGRRARRRRWRRRQIDGELSGPRRATAARAPVPAVQKSTAAATAGGSSAPRASPAPPPSSRAASRGACGGILRRYASMAWGQRRIGHGARAACAATPRAPRRSRRRPCFA